MSNTRYVSFNFRRNEGIQGNKLIYPSASRSQEPILQVLKRFIFTESDVIDNESPLFLEIASGSGQHVYHFAPHFPGVIFQPSEVDENLIDSITCYADSCPTKNVLEPICLDISRKLKCYGFEENSIDYIYSSSMIHISPYECTIGLFESAGEFLKSDALMITYGPYSEDGIITPESNIQFNASLKARDPSWGLREINQLIKLGEENNLTLIHTFEMPTNNKTLIWKKN